MNHLLVGTELGLFIFSSENREKWRISSQAFGGYAIFSCATNLSENSPVLYAGANSTHWGPAIFFSRDLGFTWREAKTNPRFKQESGISVEEIWNIQVDLPDRPGSFYVGTAPAALFHSNDYGMTWEEIAGLSQHETRPLWKPCRGGLCLHSILVDPGDSRHIVVGISAVGVFETFDSGKNWNLAHDGLDQSGPVSCVHKMVLASNGIIYQQNHVGVWKRGLHEKRWIQIDEGLPSRYGFSIAVHPSKPDIAYVIPLESPEMRAPREGKLTVYKTSNTGKDWSPVCQGLPYPAFTRVLREAFTTEQNNPCGLYFGTTSGSIFASLDEGETWIEIARNLPKIFAVHPFSI